MKYCNEAPVLYMCNVHIAVFTLDAGPLARCQCQEGPATDHLDTGFVSRFPCVFKANAEVVPKISKMSLHASHVAPPL